MLSGVQIWNFIISSFAVLSPFLQFYLHFYNLSSTLGANSDNWTFSKIIIVKEEIKKLDPLLLKKIKKIAY